MHHFIPYSCQNLEEDDIEAVVRVLRSDWLTQGPAIAQFEKSVSDYCGVEHAVAVSSATAGLHLACMALGIGAGDLVWTSPLSFAASANCARYVGAEVDFVDIDAHTGNMCMTTLSQKLEQADASKALPKLVIVVHYAGRSCDMEALGKLKKRYGFKVMEDAAHSLGAHYANGKPVGSTAVGDVCSFSFHPVKPITTGEGGVVTTHDATLGEHIRMLRTHGITREASQLRQKNKPAWYYEQQELGFNYRISDICAALGTSQMGKLDRFIAARRALAVKYEAMLKSLPLKLPPPDQYCGWHLYSVVLDSARTKLTRDALFAKLREKNIGVNVHYIPIHLHPYYRALGFTEGQFPKAEAFFAGCLSLPLHPKLSEADQEFVVQTLTESFKHSES